MLGAIIGDIVGSVYEFNNYRAKDFTPFFYRRAFYPDDTVYTIAVADALINERHPGGHRPGCLAPHPRQHARRADGTLRPGRIASHALDRKR